MRLADLNPRWCIDTERLNGVILWDPRRHGMGVSFRCPHLGCRHRLGVMFTNPLDAGAPALEGRLWQRTGETFDTLTLESIIDASVAGHWIGAIINWEVT